MIRVKFSKEEFLVLMAGCLGVAMAFYVYHLGLTRVLTDQNAHLNFAKLTVESMTPGISQLGFWPPLLHILMIPVTMIDPLYQTGLAGFVVLVPFLALGAFFLYRTVLGVTNNSTLGLTAGLLFLTNPYVLYYAVTPMMEVLFLANLAGVAYFMSVWLRGAKLKFLILLGIFVALTTISRFEGLILLPVCGFLIFLRMRQKKRPGREIEAALVLFLSVASFGMFGVMLYGWVFGGTPFAFTGGWWIRDPSSFPTQYNLFRSIQYLLHASSYMLGKPLMLVSLLSVIPLFVFSSKRIHLFAPLLILVSPFIFIAITLFRGFPPLMVPELAPFGVFFNERYGLSWIGFAILSPIFLIALVQQELMLTKIKAASRIAVGLLCFLLLVGSGMHFQQKVFAEQFQEIRKNLGVDNPSQKEITKILVLEYDYGKILVTRTINDGMMSSLGIPLDNFIYEANDQLYRQTIEEPWFFARWVVMYNPKGGDDWEGAHEPIALRWGNSSLFERFYTLEGENTLRRLYKVNEGALIKLSEEHGYDLASIPSLNKEQVRWDPHMIYAQIQNGVQGTQQQF